MLYPPIYLRPFLELKTGIRHLGLMAARYQIWKNGKTKRWPFGHLEKVLTNNYRSLDGFYQWETLPLFPLYHFYIVGALFVIGSYLYRLTGKQVIPYIHHLAKLVEHF